MKQVEPAHVHERVEAGAVLVDVREPDYFDRFHLPGAINVSVNTINRRAPEVFTDNDQEIICYCNGGTRGPRAVQALLDMGYTNVFVLDGGLRRYMEMFEGQ
ncbi:MAG: rhodanese-like domain-containing protein [Marinobacter sp.]|nr:rhodanese-like domain-containing protein [Marinobacter sp.]